MSALIGVNSVGTPGPDTYSGGIGDDTYSGLDGRDFISGGGGDDLLSGGNGDDNLNGESGNDTLYGDGGFDYLSGGPGDDLLVGDDPLASHTWDTAGYYSGTGGVTVNLSIVGPQAIGGGAGVDTLVNIKSVVGTPFNDTLIGDDDNNYISGREGNDLLDGGAGQDAIEYGGALGGVNVNLNLTGPQNVGGGQGVDTILNFEAIGASSHADTLIGTAGANHFSTRGGGDYVDGGAGFDIVDFRDLTGGVSVNLNLSGANAISVNGADTLINIEGLYGSSFNDTLIGNAANNSLQGFSGDDLIDGGAGFDTVEYYDATGGVTVNLNIAGPQDVGGGHGLDTILNVENISGTFHADTLIGAAGDNYFNARGGGDYVDGGAGFDKVGFQDLTGGVSVDLNLSGANAISINGVDTLINIEGLDGSSFNDTLIGDAANNGFYGGVGDDLLDGGAGIDGVEYYGALGGVSVNLNITGPQNVGGGHGVDTILNFENIGGSFYADTLIGTAGANHFTTRGGGDHVDGGAGFDMVDFRDLGGGVNANLSLSGANAISAQGADTLIGIEGLIGSSFNDTLTGDAGNNHFHGSSGDDLLDGGDGVDIASYFEANAGVQVSLAIVGAQSVGAGQGIDTLTNIENLLGGQFNDTLIGNAQDNFLNGHDGDDSLFGADGNDNLYGGAGDDVAAGGAGADVMQGAAGNDTLQGGLGDDQLLGGQGDDLIDGGDGSDMANYTTANAAVTVSLAIVGAQAVGTDQGSDVLTNIELLYGSNFNDTLMGDTAGNFLGGHAGDDSLSGGAGDDVLRGGAGDDVLDGGSSRPVGGMRSSVGGDMAAYDDATGAVTVNLSVVGAQSIGSGVGTDTLVNIENLLGSAFGDQLTGDANANYIGAQAGNDTILGLAGDDVLEGGPGDDRIDGGADSDLASYASASGGVAVDLNIASAQAVGGGLGVDTLISIERLYGSGFNDTLIGDSQDNYIDGQVGADSVAGGAGQDVLLGGAGDDSLSGDVGDDMIYGDAGNDSIAGGSGDDVVTFSGAVADYLVQIDQSGVAVITDLRSGAPDGTDTLTGVEIARFSDGDVLLGPSVLAISSTPVSQLEGGSGGTPFSFTVARSGGVAGATTVTWTVAGAGVDPATAGDFTGGVLPSGTLTFAAGETSKTIIVSVTGDAAVEPDEGFSVTLSNPTGGASISAHLAMATILNDDVALNHAPVAAADAAVLTEDAAVVIDVLANDTDIDLGDSKVLVSLSGTVQGADVSIVSGKVVYVADVDSFDLLRSGQSVNDSFTYTMRDAAGATSTASVQVTINGVADGPVQTGGAGHDTLTGSTLDEKIDGGAGNDVLDGGEGADILLGGFGDDNLAGGAGIDSLSGADGRDTMAGGAGDDVLAGGRGSDLFDFGPGFGHDTIIDFRPGDDDIRFVGGPAFSFVDLIGHASQVGANIVIALQSGDSLQLNNLQLASLQPADFVFI